MEVDISSLVVGPATAAISIHDHSWNHFVNGDNQVCLILQNIHKLCLAAGELSRRGIGYGEYNSVSRSKEVDLKDDCHVNIGECTYDVQLEKRSLPIHIDPNAVLQGA